jgi:plasmid stabilization system protein ParE
VRLRILDLANADLLEGFRFYERQKEGVGLYFLETLLSDIESLRIFAGVHRRRFGYHRLLSKRFPFAIYYDVEGDLASVWRVLDGRRDPAWTRRQLKTRRTRGLNQ